MVKELIHKLYSSSNFYVVGVFSKNGKEAYQLLSIHMLEDELTIKERFTFDSLDFFQENNFNKDYPIILHLDGEMVINKTLDNVVGYKKSLVFGGDPDDFLFYEYSQNDQIFASVMRRTYIEDLIKELSVHELFVVGASFGPFVLANLLSMINEDSEISLPYNTLKLEQNKIQSFAANNNIDENYYINGEHLNSKEIALMGSFLGHQYPNSIITVDTDFLETSISELKYKRLFKKFGVFTISFILASLFLGHFLLKHYSTSLAEKASEYSLHQQTIQQLNSLEQEKVLKEKILQTSGINNQDFKVKYLSDVGNSIPQDISLNSIKIMPVLKKIRPQEKINFSLSNITINGETTNDVSFNTWVKELETILWVKKIDILDYKQNKAVNTFTIEITI